MPYDQQGRWIEENEWEQMMREQAARRVGAFSRYDTPVPSLYPYQAAPYGSFGTTPSVGPYQTSPFMKRQEPAVLPWDTSEPAPMYGPGSDPRLGWKFNNDPIALNEALSKPSFTEPLNVLSQQATGNFTGMPSVFGTGTQVAQVGTNAFGIPDRTYGTTTETAPVSDPNSYPNMAAAYPVTDPVSVMETAQMLGSDPALQAGDDFFGGGDVSGDYGYVPGLWEGFPPEETFKPGGRAAAIEHVTTPFREVLGTRDVQPGAPYAGMGDAPNKFDAGHPGMLGATGYDLSDPTATELTDTNIQNMLAGGEYGGSDYRSVGTDITTPSFERFLPGEDLGMVDPTHPASGGLGTTTTVDLLPFAMAALPVGPALSVGGKLVGTGYNALAKSLASKGVFDPTKRALGEKAAAVIALAAGLKPAATKLATDTMKYVEHIFEDGTKVVSQVGKSMKDMMAARKAKGLTTRAKSTRYMDSKGVTHGSKGKTYTKAVLPGVPAVEEIISKAKAAPKGAIERAIAKAQPAPPAGPSAADIQRDKQEAVNARNAAQARQDAINAQMAIEMAARQRQQQQVVAAEQARQAQADAESRAIQAQIETTRSMLEGQRDRGTPSMREILAAIAAEDARREGGMGMYGEYGGGESMAEIQSDIDFSRATGGLVD